MADQLSLNGFEDPSPPTDRLFFAIVPDPDAAARIARLAQHLRAEHELKKKPLAAERFHVTLHHVGDYAGLSHDIVSQASAAAASVALPPFEVTFDRAISFSGRPGNLPFVLCASDGAAALTEFQRVLGNALQKAGFGRWIKQKYTPHVTLLYGGSSVAERAVEPVSWTASEFVLVDSLLGHSRHVPLARWPLRG